MASRIYKGERVVGLLSGEQNFRATMAELRMVGLSAKIETFYSMPVEQMEVFSVYIAQQMTGKIRL
jgi:hypothetical protein